MDIRNYFSKNENKKKPSPKRRKNSTKRIISSDSETESEFYRSKVKEDDYKPVNPSDFFGESSSNKKKRKIFPKPDFSNDNENSTTLQNEDQIKKQISANINGSKRKKEVKSEKGGTKGKKIKKSEGEFHDDPDFKNLLVDLDKVENQIFCKTENKTPNKSELKHTNIRANTSSSCSTDDVLIPSTPESYEEKKKVHQAQYLKYLSRGGARNPGSKEIPQTKSDIFQNMVFVLTGVYESLEREEASRLIKECGGSVTTSISKKTNYLIVGEEAGNSKLEKAKKLGTAILDEDGLLNLIRSKALVSKSEKLYEITTKASKFKGKTCAKKEKVLEDKVQETYKSPENYENNSRRALSSSSELWVEKYKPTTLKSVIGQQGDRSNMKKLHEWLSHWSSYHLEKRSKIPSRPAPWATAGDNGGWAKAALLSGPPGVGKTTTAVLVAQDLGFDILELNASDARSKKSLENILSSALSSSSLSSVSKNRVIIMDEVDGMAGNEDRGGISELLSLIKTSKVPIICLCNDRNHTKMRSLASSTFDLKFTRPRIEQIKSAMMSICFKEKLKMSPDTMTEIILGCNQDIRHILNHLSMIQSSSLSRNDGSKEAQNAKKTSIKMGPWDVCKKVFSSSEHVSMSLFDKCDLFFQDYSLGPLFVQENYLSVTPEAAKNDKKKLMDLMSQTAESISYSDLIERNVRSCNAWSLLPVNAFFASVIPGHLLSGYLHGQIQFPAWLGKNSKASKHDRILQELSLHMRLSISSSKRSINFDYAQFLKEFLVRPLAELGNDGIPKSLFLMKSYTLIREDLENLNEITNWPNQSSVFAVDSKVKASFTRFLNKNNIPLPYALSNQGSKKIKSSTLEDILNQEEEEFSESENSNDEDENDAMIQKSKKSSKSKVLKKTSKEEKDSKKERVKDGGKNESYKKKNSSSLKEKKSKNQK